MISLLFFLILFIRFLFRAFRKSCNDVIESRRAIRNLNTMYADLTAEELANVADTTCIICREEMQVQQSIKRLGCQHIFHKNCLRSWFQRQQTCKFIFFEEMNWFILVELGPICRTTVLRPTAPRPAQAGAAPNAPAAGPPPPPPQQPQPQQAPNAGGITKRVIDNIIYLILVQAPPAGVVPPPSSVPPSASASASTPPPGFNFTQFNPTAAQATPPPPTVTIPQMPFGSFPMVLPPFGEFL
jgi:E3 ubiquitin-protein ligase synoviolin